MKNILVILLSLFCCYAQAEVVEIPEEELSQETVMPKFDFPDNVRNRTVVSAKKFEVGGYLGWNISEPIYNQSKFGLNLGYHINEENAIIVNYASWAAGQNTQYTDGLAVSPYLLDFSRAPKQLNSYYLHYEWKMFYGKISFTKQAVANIAVYPIFGLGQTKYEHRAYSGVDLGIGQKFYLSSNFAIRADFKFQYSEAPSPFLTGKMRTDQSPAPQPTEFKNRYIMNTILDLGVSFLL